MSSRATLNRRKFGDRINEYGFLVMVACRRCQKQRLPCKMSSLSERCGHCVRVGRYDCEPGDLPRTNFAVIDKEKERLQSMEEDAEREDAEAMKANVEAMERSRLARAKLSRVREQKRFLRLREQKMFDEGLKSVEELEALEAAQKIIEGVQGAGVEKNTASVAETSSPRVEERLVGVSNVPVGEGTSLNDGSPLFSPGEHFPESRLASEEIAAFDAFAAKMFPLPGLLDPDIMS